MEEKTWEKKRPSEWTREEVKQFCTSVLAPTLDVAAITAAQKLFDEGVNGQQLLGLTETTLPEKPYQLIAGAAFNLEKAIDRLRVLESLWGQKEKGFVKCFEFKSGDWVVVPVVDDLPPQLQAFRAKALKIIEEKKSAAGEFMKLAFEEGIELLSALPPTDPYYFPPFYLSAERKKVLSFVLGRSFCLDRDEERGNSMRCAVLQGEKGTGKSTTLGLGSMLVALMTRKVIAVYLRFDCFRKKPAEMRFLPTILPSIGAITYGAELVTGRKGDQGSGGSPRILWFPDESEDLWALRPCPQRKEAVHESHACTENRASGHIGHYKDTGQSLGKATERCLLSGSSRWLRTLVFSEYKDLPDLERFPSLNAIGLENFNHGKFDTLVISPFRERVAFEECVRSVARARQLELPVDDDGNVDDGFIQELFLFTGGNLRNIDAAVAYLAEERAKEGGEDVSLSDYFEQSLKIGVRKALDSDLLPVFEALAKANTSQVRNKDPFEQATISYREARKYATHDQIMKAGEDGSLDVVMAERGQQPHSVGLPIPAYLPLILSMGAKYEERDKIAMMYPYGSLGEHIELLLRESLREKKWEGACVDNGRVFSGARPDSAMAKGHAAKKYFQAVDKRSLLQIAGELLKMAPDYGVDILHAIFILIQVKAGRGEISGTEAKEISKKILWQMNKESKPRKGAKDHLSYAKIIESLGFDSTELKPYLATTRPLSPAAIKVFEKNGITVLCREDLYDLWSKKVSDIGHSLKDDTYVSLVKQGTKRGRKGTPK